MTRADVLPSLALGLICGAARADQAASPSGPLQQMRERGIDLHLRYVADIATNTAGGARELWRYADQWTFAGTFDLGRLTGLDHALFQVTVTDRNGRNLSTDANLGSLQEVQGVYGRGETWHWTQFYFQQKYLEERLDWKIGRLGGGADFATFPCEFMNLTFCGTSPGNLSPRYWYNTPISQWATRLQVVFKGFGYGQLGAYEVNPRYLETRSGLNLGEPGGATGVLVPLELAWQPTFGGRFSGTYRFGAWYNSSPATDAFDPADRSTVVVTSRSSRRHNGHFGAYVNLLQRLRGPRANDAASLDLFFRATFDDRGSATTDSQFTAGLLCTGVFPARPADELGLAIGRTHLNDRVRRADLLVAAQEGAISARPAAEYASEIFYGVHLASWLELRPDIQYIHQREALPVNRNIVVAGVKVIAGF